MNISSQILEPLKVIDLSLELNMRAKHEEALNCKTGRQVLVCCICYLLYLPQMLKACLGFLFCEDCSQS